MKTRMMFLATVRWMKSFIFSLADILGLTQAGQVAFVLDGKTGSSGATGADIFGWFKPEKIVIYGDGGKVLDATLLFAFVDGTNQFPVMTPGSGIPCSAFSLDAKGDVVSWDVACRRIDLTVQFHRDEKFFATIFGKLI